MHDDDRTRHFDPLFNSMHRSLAMSTGHNRLQESSPTVRRPTLSLLYEACTDRMPSSRATTDRKGAARQCEDAPCPSFKKHALIEHLIRRMYTSCPSHAARALIKELPSTTEHGTFFALQRDCLPPFDYVHLRRGG